MKWTFFLLLAIVLLSACTTAPDVAGPLGCDEIGNEADCLANSGCDTIYKTIFNAIPETGEYTSQDVYQNCAVRGALP